MPGWADKPVNKGTVHIRAINDTTMYFDGWDHPRDIYKERFEQVENKPTNILQTFAQATLYRHIKQDAESKKNVQELQEKTKILAELGVRKAEVETKYFSVAEPSVPDSPILKTEREISLYYEKFYEKSDEVDAKLFEEMTDLDEKIATLNQRCKELRERIRPSSEDSGWMYLPLISGES